jgi:DNA-binding response OmpR family regulator
MKVAHLHILLVEDHADTARLVERLLHSSGYIVTTAHSLSQVRALAEAFHFGFLISDLGLPDGDGAEALAEVRRHYPIEGIVVSGYGAPSDLKRSEDAGYAAHLVKPVTLEQLVAAVEAHARRSTIDFRPLRRKEPAGHREGEATPLPSAATPIERVSAPRQQ